METADPVQICGYIHRRGKKKFLALWHRWFGVLNGRLLLFYKSETEHAQLSQPHDFIDLRLAYNVTSGPGVNQGILISTHRGPCMLRIRNKEMHKKWLEALETAAFVKNVETVNEKTETEDTANEKTLKKNRRLTVGDPMISLNVSGDSNLPKSWRSSLNIIPGQNYSTYDGRRLDEFISTEDVGYHSNAPKSNILNVKEKMAKVKKGNRPLSGSVSDFLLMSLQSRRNSGVRTEKYSAPADRKGDAIKKRTSFNPNIRVNIAVGRILSLAREYHSDASNKNEDAADLKTPKKDTAPVDVSNIVKHNSPKQSKEKVVGVTECANEVCIHSEEMLFSIERREKVHLKDEFQNDKVTTQAPSASVTKTEDAAVNMISTQNKEKTSKINDRRRRSSLATLKDFFFPRKHGRSHNEPAPIRESKGDITSQMNIESMELLSEPIHFSEFLEEVQKEVQTASPISKYEVRGNATSKHRAPAPRPDLVLSETYSQEQFIDYTKLLKCENKTAVVLEVLEPNEEVGSSNSRTNIQEPKIGISNGEKFTLSISDSSANPNLQLAAASWAKKCSKLVSTKSHEQVHAEDPTSLRFQYERESRPVLPLKTRLRRPPSPPYDIPHAISCPTVFCEHLLCKDLATTGEMHPINENSKSLQLSITKINAKELANRRNLVQDHNSSRKMKEVHICSCPSIQSTNISGQCFLKEEKCIENKDEIKSDADPSTKFRSDTKISPLVNYLKQKYEKSDERQENTDLNDRLSFAANEIVIMDEETVEEL